jgi:phenylacetate-CoA ligase
MLIIRGVNVFPTAIEDVLLGFTELAPHYRIIVDRPSGLDTLVVEVEHHAAAAIDDPPALRRQVEIRLSELLLVSAEIRIVAPGTIERIEAGKAQRVFDRRALMASHQGGGR